MSKNSYEFASILTNVGAILVAVSATISWVDGANVWGSIGLTTLSVLMLSVSVVLGIIALNRTYSDGVNDTNNFYSAHVTRITELKKRHASEVETSQREYQMITDAVDKAIAAGYHEEVVAILTDWRLSSEKVRHTLLEELDIYTRPSAKA